MKLIGTRRMKVMSTDTMGMGMGMVVALGSIERVWAYGAGWNWWNPLPW
jgi:hypothetical protein